MAIKTGGLFATTEKRRLNPPTTEVIMKSLPSKKEVSLTFAVADLCMVVRGKN